ncbi:hypothetical protein [Nocardia sp. BMG111209]|uniref:hypothetical protein n=1 Tax=Nocardia sp. BMG111209 TaxID=1160137 RepID=UPI0003638CA2|nr:hypothetical protein [Nocardia sp. BMG111209]
MDAVRIEILDGTVTLRRPNAVADPLDGEEDARTLALLAMRAPNRVPVQELWRDEHDIPALHARLTRLRNRGLDIPRGNARQGYRLNLDPDRVDGQQLVAAARAGRAQHTIETVTEALRLWRAGPPRFLEPTSIWDELHTARTKLIDLRALLRRRRLLIVEDRVGPRLMSLLGEFDCTLVTNIEEFWPLHRGGLDERFDAVLVDQHLSASYNDRDGLVIADAISRSRVRIPVVLMTFDPPRNMTHVDFLAKYNLEDVVPKSDDSATSDFHVVVQKIRTLFEDDREGVDARAIGRIQQTLPRMRTFARKWLIEQGREGDISVMELQHDDLHRISYRKDLAALREAQHRFAKRYGLPGPPQIQG